MRVAIALVSICALQASAPISDPLAFVSDVYKHFAKPSPASSTYQPPDDIYTPRLQKLIRDDRKRAKGEVGCLDFDFWVNGQDWELKNVKVTAAAAGPDRKTIIARFINIDTPEEIHFDFRQIGGRWLLDDVHSVKNTPWTLSEILRCTP
jgi:hypothetical protein